MAERPISRCPFLQLPSLSTSQGTGTLVGAGEREVPPLTGLAFLWDKHKAITQSIKCVFFKGEV